MTGALIELQGWEIKHYLRPAVMRELLEFRERKNAARVKQREQDRTLRQHRESRTDRDFRVMARRHRHWRRLDALQKKLRAAPWRIRMRAKVASRMATVRVSIWMESNLYPRMPLRITPIPYFATKPVHLDAARELLRAVKQRPTSLDKWSVPVALWLHYRGTP